MPSHIFRDHSQNLVHHLLDREAGGFQRQYTAPQLSGSFTSTSDDERIFYTSITPNLTIQNVDKPNSFIRKFTPDGRRLLSFSTDQRSLEVYDYAGVARVADFLKGQVTECITAADHSFESLHIRQCIYERLLQLRWSIRLTPADFGQYEPTHLNREFSIFMDDGRYVLLASVSAFTEPPPFSNIIDYPDLFDSCDLYSFTFYLVDLQHGRKCDQLSYRHDNIVLAHNHGVSVYGHRIAIMSKYRQCIDLLELVGDKIVPLYSVGPFGSALDAATVREIPPTRNACGDVLFEGLPFSHLKQRILAYMYHEAIQIEGLKERQNRLKEFYKMFKIYENMIMVKMQLIDTDNMLMRFEMRPTTQNVSAASLDVKLYVFYEISSQKISRIFRQDSVDLLYLLRDCCDIFRNVRSLQTQRPSPSSSNNAYFRAGFNNAITSMAGGQDEAALRFNPTLPISTQSFATTQYLDFSLFMYDDRLISALERPKICQSEPIRFNDRNTNITKFRLHLEAPSGEVVYPSFHRELVAFIFHPYEPFIISIQKMLMRYVVNFHIYNKSTVVTP